MGETALTVLLAVISTGLLSGLGTSMVTSWKNRRHSSDNAWDQRDKERHRADVLHEALRTHRNMCNKEHGMLYKDMDPFPRV